MDYWCGGCACFFFPFRGWNMTVFLTPKWTGGGRALVVFGFVISHAGGAGSAKKTSVTSAPALRHAAGVIHVTPVP